MPKGRRRSWTSEARMGRELTLEEIHAELLKLQAESNTLMQTISDNMKELGL